MSLEQAFESRGQRRGGILLLPPSAATELIAVARTERVRVLGVDGFFLSENGTLPSMEHSIDLSQSDGPADPWNSATQFVQRWPALDLWFEIVLDE